MRFYFYAYLISLSLYLKSSLSHFWINWKYKRVTIKAFLSFVPALYCGSNEIKMKTHRAYTTILRYQIEIFSFWRNTNKYVTVNTRTNPSSRWWNVRDERKFFYLLLEWEEFNLPRTDSDFIPRFDITWYPLENVNFDIRLIFNIFISFISFISIISCISR